MPRPDPDPYVLVNQVIWGPAPGAPPILLTAGDKAGNWGAWYEWAIPLAERAYAEYLAEREKESGE